MTLFPSGLRSNTALGMSNANCCRIFSVLPYEKHLSTRAKTSFCFWCSARVSMVNGVGLVVGGHPVPLLWSHSTWHSWRRGWELLQEVRAVLYSKLADSCTWVWNHSEFNGNIAGGRLGLCCANAGNDGWHNLPSSFTKHSLLKETFLFDSQGGAAWVAVYIFLLRRTVVGGEAYGKTCKSLMHSSGCMWGAHSAHEFWTSAHGWQACVLSFQLMGCCQDHAS